MARIVSASAYRNACACALVPAPLFLGQGAGEARLDPVGPSGWGLEGWLALGLELALLAVAVLGLAWLAARPAGPASEESRTITTTHDDAPRRDR